MPAINSVGVREKLPPRREPYWLRITQGRFIGFRKLRRGASGTWSARFYDGEGGYTPCPLGDFAELAEKDRFDAAKKAAEEWFAHIDLGGSTEPGTVKEACEAALETIKAERGEQAARDTEGYFRRLVYNDPIATVKLSKLTKNHMSGWRSRVLAYNGDLSSFNRNITPMRRALNLAHEQGKIASDQPWLVNLRPFGKKAVKAQCERSRAILLSPDERSKLIAKASKESRPFFKALALLPMRPGEIAALRVEHLSPGDRVLKIRGKTEERTIPLPAQALAHLKACAKGKMPSDWLIARADGGQWRKEQWRDEVKAAAKKAKLPTATVAYSLRHSLITELVTGKTARTGKKKRGGNFDLFTVAKISGTSVRMIEETYGHLQNEHAREALASLALGR